MNVTNRELATLRRELEAERTRRRALEADWHRMRDIERQWVRFGRLTVIATVVLGLLAIAVMGGA